MNPCPDLGLDRLLPTLGTISGLKPGEKLRVRKNQIKIDNRWCQWLFRNYDKESREVTIAELKLLYGEIMTKINSLDAIGDYNKLLQVANYLANSSSGLLNLKKTYQESPEIVCQIQWIIDAYIVQGYEHIVAELPSRMKPTFCFVGKE